MGVRVMLVDDHALFRQGLRGLLATRGIEVVAEAEDGARALALVDEAAPDLVLMDLDMPELGGLEATRLIKARHPDLPVVILTASEAEDNLFEAVKSGASGYLLKSYAADDVVRLVLGAAAGDPALTPDLASKLLREFARIGGAQAPPGSPGVGRLAAAATPPPDGLIEPLTTREREVLEQLVDGASNKEIAARLFVSENTVKYHLKNILQKLHLHNRAQVVAYALRWGIARPGGG